MVAWFAANGGTLLVLAVLLAIVCGILRTMRRDRAQGRNSCGVKCGGGCAGCSGCGGCHG